jgi:hypothetical protein
MSIHPPPSIVREAQQQYASHKFYFQLTGHAVYQRAYERLAHHMYIMHGVRLC